jgi:hypothetical protein
MTNFTKFSLVAGVALLATMLNTIAPVDAAMLGFSFNLQPGYPTGSGSFTFDTSTATITNFQISSGSYSFSNPAPQQVDLYSGGQGGFFSIFTGFNFHNELLNISFSQPDLNVIGSTGSINYGQFTGNGATSTAQFLNGVIGIYGGEVKVLPSQVPPTSVPEPENGIFSHIAYASLFASGLWMKHKIKIKELI